MTKEDIKILICDDSILARKLLKDALMEIGCSNFVEAKNGEESISLFLSESPDLVLLDIVMPIFNGVEVTKKIIDNDPQANIVIVSSVGTKNFLEDALAAGAKDFIQKPFRSEMLDSIINKLCV
ncbi:MAG: response regulator [Eubacterium sp.]|nr:response regulator [Eubacterium sp.]